VKEFSQSVNIYFGNDRQKFACTFLWLTV